MRASSRPASGPGPRRQGAFVLCPIPLLDTKYVVAKTTSSNLRVNTQSESEDRMWWTEVLFNLADISFKSRVVVHGAALSKTQRTNYLKGISRHYAFPIKSLKLIQIEPNQNILSNLYIFIHTQPIRIFSLTCCQTHFSRCWLLMSSSYLISSLTPPGYDCMALSWERLPALWWIPHPLMHKPFN